jgi:glycerophosphoryl diester phosphodiesterase
MTLVAAHRGLSAEEPENTLAAFRAAAEAGFPCIELDVRLTHDEEVVVLHDASLARTTDGTGRVADLDYDELRSYQTAAGPVPRLDDVFAALSGWGGLWDVELKAGKAAEPVLELLRYHDLLDRCLVSAMDPRALTTMLELHPEVSRGLITLGPPDVEDLDTAQALVCDWLAVDHDFLKDPVLAQIRQRGLKVAAWTVNDPDRALHLAEAGVDMVITDTRDVLRAIPGSVRGL